MKIINGAVAFARENQINLLCLEGGCIHSPNENDNARNIIYDLINPEDIAGIIILTASIGYLASHAQRSEFSRRFYPLPLVSIGHEIEGCHSITIDNATGLRELLLHLSEVHQYRRFAFIKGPESHQDALDRLAVFKATLHELGIAFDPDLVVAGSFDPLSGANAVEILIDQRKADFEVIVSANDEMALGALNELNQRGIKVPDDVAVVGFDNIDRCSFANPPLTTVSQSLEEQGRQAVAILLDIIAQRPTPPKVLVPTKLVLHESCGCFSKATLIGALEEVYPQTFLQERLLPDQRQVVSAVSKKIAQFSAQYPENHLQWIEELVAALYRDLILPDKSQFLKVGYQLLDRIMLTDENIQICQNIVSELRKQLLPQISEPKLSLRIEDLMHQARVMIGEKAVLKGKINYQQAMQSNLILNYISEELLSIGNISELMEVLTRRLPQLKISSGYILEFENQTVRVKSKNRLMMAFNKYGRIEVNQSQNPFTRRFIPDFIKEDPEPHTMYVVPLIFAKTQFGLLTIEMHFFNQQIYEALRRIICSSLQGVLLMKQVREHEKNIIAQNEHLKNLAEMRKAMEGFIRTISLTVEVKDPYTAGHQNKVAALAGAIAQEMNLSPDMMETVRMAAMVHDLGKISIPAEILNKPGKLTPLEFCFIKDHPKVAYDILKTIELQWPISQVILQHHERLNGSGYPVGLKGAETMMEAKIIAVADVIEAMASHRPYRAALGIEAALDEIERNKGVLYEGAVVDACMKLFREEGYHFKT